MLAENIEIGGVGMKRVGERFASFGAVKFKVETLQLVLIDGL